MTVKKVRTSTSHYHQPTLKEEECQTLFVTKKNSSTNTKVVKTKKIAVQTTFYKVKYSDTGMQTSISYDRKMSDNISDGIQPPENICSETSEGTMSHDELESRFLSFKLRYQAKVSFLKVKKTFKMSLHNLSHQNT